MNHRRAADGWAELAAVWPLALRSLRRFRLRYALMAGLLGLAITAYLLYGTFLAGAGSEAALSLGPYELPCDVALIGARRGLTESELNDWRRRGGVEHLSTGRITWYHSDLGSIRVLALPADSPLWSAAGCAPADGAGTALSPLPQPKAGQILLPPSLAGRLGADTSPAFAGSYGGSSSGASLALIPPRAHMGRIDAAVVGFHQATDDLLRNVALTLMVTPGPAPNCLFIEARTSNAAASLASTMRVDYLQPTRPLLYRPDGPAVLWSGAADDMIQAVLAGTYMPGAGVMTLIFAFCGIGLFTITSLSFLDRKRDLAILKTIGLESRGLTAMLMIEQALVALVAFSFGLGTAVLILPVVSQYLPQGSALSLATVVKSLVVGLAVQGAGIVLPSMTARIATVNQLLFNLPIPLERRRIYASKE